MIIYSYLSYAQSINHVLIFILQGQNRSFSYYYEMRYWGDKNSRKRRSNHSSITVRHCHTIYFIYAAPPPPFSSSPYLSYNPCLPPASPISSWDLLRVGLPQSLVRDYLSLSFLDEEVWGKDLRRRTKVSWLSRLFADSFRRKSYAVRFGLWFALWSKDERRRFGKEEEDCGVCLLDARGENYKVVEDLEIWMWDEDTAVMVIYAASYAWHEIMCLYGLDATCRIRCFCGSSACVYLYLMSLFKTHISLFLSLWVSMHEA